jgi:hypothetical protein
MASFYRAAPDIPPDEVLPCGCIIRCSVVEGVKTLMYIPCRKDCAHYLNMLRLAAEANRPVTKKEAP